MELPSSCTRISGARKWPSSNRCAPFINVNGATISPKRLFNRRLREESLLWVHGEEGFDKDRKQIPYTVLEFGQALLPNQSHSAR